MQKITVLCTNKKNNYNNIEGVETYDIKRNARTFAGSNPVITHAPCRGYSKLFQKQDIPLPGEMDLALFAFEEIYQNGGIFEHPKNSTFFTRYGLPRPGTSKKGFKTIEIYQSWFGYRIRKATASCPSNYKKHKIQIIIGYGLT